MAGLDFGAFGGRLPPPPSGAWGAEQGLEKAEQAVTQLTQAPVDKRNVELHLQWLHFLARFVGEMHVHQALATTRAQVNRFRQMKELAMSLQRVLHFHVYSRLQRW
jgi:hypothetical protein